MHDIIYFMSNMSIWANKILKRGIDSGSICCKCANFPQNRGQLSTSKHHGDTSLIKSQPGWQFISSAEITAEFSSTLQIEKERWRRYLQLLALSGFPWIVDANNYWMKPLWAGRNQLEMNVFITQLANL